MQLTMSYRQWDDQGARDDRPVTSNDLVILRYVKDLNKKQPAIDTSRNGNARYNLALEDVKWHDRISRNFVFPENEKGKTSDTAEEQRQYLGRVPRVLSTGPSKCDLLHCYYVARFIVLDTRTTTSVVDSSTMAAPEKSMALSFSVLDPSTFRRGMKKMTARVAGTASRRLSLKIHRLLSRVSFPASLAK